MTLEQFIFIANDKKSKEVIACQKWLYKQIRMGINKDFVSQKKKWKIKFASTGTSLIEPDILDNNCNNKIIDAIDSIIKCNDVLENQIRKIAPKCEIEVSQLLEKVSKNLKKQNRIGNQNISTEKLTKKWEEFYISFNDQLKDLSENIQFDYPQIENIDLEHFYDIIEKENLSGANGLFNYILGCNSEKGAIDILRQYNYEEKWLPREGDAYSITLGYYAPSEERIVINLNPIYDISRSKGIDPLILLRMTLIHEMAHCLHHIGIDGDNKIWEDFGYGTYGKNTIEGLAQWYTYRYMYSYDKLKKNKIPINFILSIWFCQHEPPQYRHFMKWHQYNYENMNRVLVEARRNKNLKESTGSAFDDELEKNHLGKTV